MTMRERILALAEEDYRAFAAALLPNIDGVIGVRLPILRKLAQEIARNDWRRYLATVEDAYFEEVMLRGMVIGCAKTDIDERLAYAAAFIPKINSWSVCDSFCTGLKCTSNHKERMWEFVQPYVAAVEEYAVRFGVVMLLNYYIEEAYIERVLKLLDNAKHEGYYVKMAVAWAVSVCFVKLPELTLAYLSQNTLDDFTYNKALQKITESYRVDQATKQLIRSMKRSRRLSGN